MVLYNHPAQLTNCSGWLDEYIVKRELYPQGCFCPHFGSLGIVKIVGFVARFSCRSAPQNDSIKIIVGLV